MNRDIEYPPLPKKPLLLIVSSMKKVSRNGKLMNEKPTILKKSVTHLLTLLGVTYLLALVN